MVIQFPIGETQRDQQRRDSESFAANLCGNPVLCEVVSFSDYVAEKRRKSAA